MLKYLISNLLIIISFAACSSTEQKRLEAPLFTKQKIDQDQVLAKREIEFNAFMENTLNSLNKISGEDKKKKRENLNSYDKYIDRTLKRLIK